MPHYYIKTMKTGDKDKFKYQVAYKEVGKPEKILKPVYMKRETAMKKAKEKNEKSKGGKGNRRGKMTKPEYESL